MAKTDVDAAVERLKKALEPVVTPKGKAPQSMGGNPEAKAAVQIPTDDEEDAENEELDGGKISSSAKKGKVKNQFAGNDGEINEDKDAKKSWGDKLRDVASRLRKGAFDDDDDAPPSDETADDDMGDGDYAEADNTLGDSDAELEQALTTIKNHPKVLQALAHALAELMASSGTQTDDDDYGDDENPEAEPEDMSMAMSYSEALAKALVDGDESGELAKAIQGEPVVAALSEYLVALGDEIFSRDDESQKVIKAQAQQIDALIKSQSKLVETVNGIADVLVALNETQGNIEKSMSDVANTPRVPSPGLQVVRGDGKPLQKGGTPAAIQTEALFKALESAAGRGDETAAEALALVPVNPRAAFAALDAEARKEYDTLIQG